MDAVLIWKIVNLLGDIPLNLENLDLLLNIG
jgi:hypothetical protein